MAPRGGCARSVGCVALLILLAAGAWMARDSIGDWMGRFELAPGGQPSERLARRAEDKLNALARSRPTDEVRFSEAELQSLLTYRGGPALPTGVEDPRIDVQDTVVVLSARIRPDSLEGFAAPEALSSSMGDTTRVVTGLSPAKGAAGEALLRVRSLQIGSFVVPPIMLPTVVRGLEQQGVRVRDGSVVMPLFPGVGEIRIDGDDLVVVPGPAGTD